MAIGEYYCDVGSILLDDVKAIYLQAHCVGVSGRSCKDWCYKYQRILLILGSKVR
jgi:hypothetical protein